MKVKCPLCRRDIPLDPFHATNLDGQTVMQWHLAKMRPHHKECAGSYRSVQQCQKHLREALG